MNFMQFLRVNNPASSQGQQRAGAVALAPMEPFDRNAEAGKVKSKEFEEGLLTLITVSKS